MSIRENIDSVMKRVKAASVRAGRSPEDITVIAVSKTVDASRAREAVLAGLNSLGENRVQEMVNKYEHMGDLDIKWHMIGHLQKNKVKYIIDKAYLIHSLDSEELAAEIDKRAAQHGITAKVLVELNIGEEESKFGINKDNVYDFVRSLEQFGNIMVMGIMTVAPPCDDPEEVRWVFKEMKNIYEKLKTKGYKNADMKYLSMGMTGDFEVAIEEGANIIRIGTAIFGARNYTKEEK